MTRICRSPRYVAFHRRAPSLRSELLRDVHSPSDRRARPSDRRAGYSMANERQKKIKKKIKFDASCILEKKFKKKKKDRGVSDLTRKCSSAVRRNTMHGRPAVVCGWRCARDILYIVTVRFFDKFKIRIGIHNPIKVNHFPKPFKSILNNLTVFVSKTSAIV